MYISFGRIFHGGVKVNTVNVLSVISFGSTRSRRPVPKVEPKRVPQRPAAKTMITMPRNAVFKRVPKKNARTEGEFELQSQTLLPDGRTLILIHEAGVADPEPNVWVPLEPGVGQILHVGQKRILASCRWCVTRGRRLFDEC